MRPLPLLLVLLVLLGGVACGSSEDEGAEHTGATGPGGLELSSPAFGEGEPIPDEHTGIGTDAIPPLEWGDVPTDTRELALVVVDPDARNFVHWVVAGIDPETTGIEAGTLPPGAVQARNDFEQIGWAGPQPPSGTTHTYVFTLYALTEPSGVTEGQDGAEAIALIDATPGTSVTLRAEYGQP